MTYDEDQMKAIAVQSFRLGMKIGKREATRYEQTLAIGLEEPQSRDVMTGLPTRTRGHLTLIQGGAA